SRRGGPAWGIWREDAEDCVNGGDCPTGGGRRDLSRVLSERKSAYPAIQRSRHRSVRDFSGQTGAERNGRIP
ncbi:MAG TPA: hypothetical protein VFO40_25790, partial [Chthoniobacterales bacterium]|nr:hypothetical protein [Chthoniobacterales bacterium]